MFQVGIWEIHGELSNAVPVSLLANFDNSCYKCLQEESNMLLPRFSVTKPVFWAIKFVQSYCWLSVSHVTKCCYTSLLSNFEHIHTSKWFSCFTNSLDSACLSCRLWAGAYFISHVFLCLVHKKEIFKFTSSKFRKFCDESCCNCSIQIVFLLFTYLCKK